MPTSVLKRALLLACLTLLPAAPASAIPVFTGSPTIQTTATTATITFSIEQVQDSRRRRAGEDVRYSAGRCEIVNPTSCDYATAPNAYALTPEQLATVAQYTAPNRLSVTITGLTPSTPYSYVLRARNDGSDIVQTFGGTNQTTFRTTAESAPPTTTTTQTTTPAPTPPPAPAPVQPPAAPAPPLPTSCPAGFTARTYQTSAVKLSGCLVVQQGRVVGRSPVYVNGVRFTASDRAGSRRDHTFAGCSPECTVARTTIGATPWSLWLDPNDRSIGTTYDTSIAIGTVRFYNGPVAQSNTSFAGGSTPLLKVGTNLSVDLFGFPLQGEAKLSPRTDGSAVLSAYAGIPFLNGVNGGVALKARTDGTLDLEGLDLNVGTATFKGFDFGGMSLKYSASDRLWAGSADVKLLLGRPVTVKGAVQVVSGRLRSLTVGVSDLNQPLGQGVFLQDVTLMGASNPISVGGSLGITAGPQVLGNSLVGLDAGFAFKGPETVTYPSGFDLKTLKTTYATADLPASFVLTGGVSVASVPLGGSEARIFLVDYPWFKARGGFGLRLAVGGQELVSGTVALEVAVKSSSFSAQGSAQLAILGKQVAAAYALLNGSGIYGCARLAGSGIGFKGPWGGTPKVVLSCDSAYDVASSAQAANGAVTVPGGGRPMLFTVRGAGGAVPQVVLRGPGGTTIDMPAGGDALAVVGTTLVLRDPTTGTTSLRVRAPRAGRWTVEAKPGSPAVTSFSVRRAFDAPTVRATVSGSGPRRRLRWTAQVPPGARIVFRESGVGLPRRTVLTTTRASGSVTFRPAIARETRRTIEAQVVGRGGNDTIAGVVARFRTPLASLARPTALRLRRGARTARLSWTGSAVAVRYDLLVRRADGSVRLQRATRPRAVLSGVGRRDVVSVTITPYAIDGAVGPAGKRTFRPARARRG